MEWHDLQKDGSDMPYLDVHDPWRSCNVLCELVNGTYSVCHYNVDEEGWIDSNGFRQQVRAWQDIEPRTQKTAKKVVKLQGANIQSAMTYMMARGIPKKQVKEIYSVFVDQAIKESDDFKIDRIYTAFALAIRRAYGYGYKRIRNTFREFSAMMDMVNEEGHYWDELMDELYRETGMVIHCASEYDRIIVEYRCPNGEQEEMSGEELEAYEDMVSGFEESLARMQQR